LKDRSRLCAKRHDSIAGLDVTDLAVDGRTNLCIRVDLYLSRRVIAHFHSQDIAINAVNRAKDTISTVRAVPLTRAVSACATSEVPAVASTCRKELVLGPL